MGIGASIHFNSDRGMAEGAPWQYLGVLTNDKPSAIFKVRGQRLLRDAKFLEIGISIEPLDVIEQLQRDSLAQSTDQSLVPAGTTNLPSYSPDQLVSLARGMGESLFAYLISFTRRAEEFVQIEAQPRLEVVPVQAVQEWFNSLVKKISIDPTIVLRQFQNK